MPQQSDQRSRALSKGGLAPFLLRLVVLLSMSGVLTVNIAEKTAESLNSFKGKINEPPSSNDVPLEAQTEKALISDPQKNRWHQENTNINVQKHAGFETSGQPSDLSFIGDNQPPGTEKNIEAKIVNARADDNKISADENKTRADDNKTSQLPPADHTVILSDISNLSGLTRQEEIEIETSEKMQNFSHANNKFDEKRFRRQSYSSGCGYVELRGSGIVASPSYPSSYQNDLRCTWRLVADAGCREIFLQILRFSTEACHDYLLIEDSGGNRRTICGNKHTEFYTLPSPIRLTFVTDSSVVSSGFEISFSSVHNSSGFNCGAYSSSGSGVIRSPSFPAPYQNNIACVWKLESTPEIGAVYLRFLHFATEWEADKVRFFSKFGYYVTHSGIVRGWIRLPSPAYITFTSDSSVAFIGFEIAFRSLPPNVDYPDRECFYRLTSSGLIRSTNFPNNYDNGLMCLWDVEAADGNNAVALIFRHFSTENCCDHLRVSSFPGVWNSYSGAIGPRVEYFTLPASISFRTDHSITSTGFEIEYRTLQLGSGVSGVGCSGTKIGSGILRSPNYPGNYQDGDVCGWRLEAQANSGVIFVQIVNFSTEECCDRLKISNSTHLQAEIKGSVRPQSFTISSPAFISFTADGSVTSSGFEILFSSVSQESHYPATAQECGGFRTGSGVIRSPGYPRNYFTGISCLWKLEAAPGYAGLFLQVLDFSTQCASDYLTISNGTLIRAYLSRESRHRFFTFESPLFITFAPLCLETSRGFEIAFNSVHDPTNSADRQCGTTLVGSGIIRSPLYPESYPDNSGCYWRLEAPFVNGAIFLQIIDFSTEQCCDYVRISNGTSIYTSLSGVTEPQSMTLGSTAIVTFSSDSSITSTGFLITFSSFSMAKNETGVKCGGYMTGSGIIRSPGYPDNYRDYTACVWTIEPASGRDSIFLQILNFSTEQCCDYLQIHNSSGLITSISGVSGPQLMTFNSPVIISFTTDGSVTSAGFEIAFTTVESASSYAEDGCSGSLTGFGVIRSPGYPGSYPSNIVCLWRLEAAPGYSALSLQILYFSTESCCAHLRILNSSGIEATISGVVTPRNLTLGSPTFIIFTTENSTNFTGFEIAFDSVQVPENVQELRHTDSGIVQGTPCFKTLQSAAAGFSWYEARSRCRLLGGFLVEIESSDEQNNVEDYLRSHVQSSEEVWIGLKRGSMAEDPWQWDTGRPLAYTNWIAGQPTSIGANETCAALNFRNRLGWSIFDCSQLKVPLCILPRCIE